MLLIINLVYVVALSAAALRWGAAPERACVATLFVMTYGDVAYHGLIGRDAVYGTVDIGHLIIDISVAAAFIAVALRANRVYPLWLAAIQLVSVISHFARELTERFPTLAYGLMTYVPYYVVLLVITGGIWCHALRASRHGRYRSWRSSSNPLPVAARISPPTG